MATPAEVVSGAMLRGWGEGESRKQQLTDEERHNTYKMYADQLAALRNKLSMVPKDSKEYQDTFSALENTVGQIKDL